MSLPTPWLVEHMLLGWEVARYVRDGASTRRVVIRNDQGKPFGTADAARDRAAEANKTRSVYDHRTLPERNDRPS